MYLQGPDRARVDALIAVFDDAVHGAVREVYAPVHAALDALRTQVPAGGRAPLDLGPLGAIQPAWLRFVREVLLAHLARAYQLAADWLRGQLPAPRPQPGLPGVGAPEPAWPGPSGGLAELRMAQAANRLRGVGETLWRQMRDSLTEGIAASEGIDELAARVAHVGAVALGRARTIARTEVISAVNLGSFDQAAVLAPFDAGMQKGWLATEDVRTRPTHEAADGQWVAMGERFQVGQARLLVPGDPTGPADEVINCRCTQVYRFNEGGAVASETEQGAVVAAAGDDDAEHAGAMLALRMSEPDAARLALADGKAADDLHLTIAYLGQAADIDDEARGRLRADVAAWAAEQGGPVEGDAFAANVFNPASAERDTALVLGVGGRPIAEAATWLRMAARRAYEGMPEQHEPFVAHVTLAYSDDLGALPELVKRQGPIVFDRVRLAFGPEVIDVPIGAPAGEEGEGMGEQGLGADVAQAAERDVDAPGGDGHSLREYWVHGPGAVKIGWGTPGDFERCVTNLREHVKDPEGLCNEYHQDATGGPPGKGHGHGEGDTDAAANAAVDAGAVGSVQDAAGEVADAPAAGPGLEFTQTAPWYGTLTMEGVQTGDRRLFAEGSMTFAPFPQPLLWTPAQIGQHDGAVVVGRIDRGERREGGRIAGGGVIDLGSGPGAEVHRLMEAGMLRGISVDLDSLGVGDLEVLYADMPAGPVGDGPMPEPEVELAIVHSARIRGATLVPFPAFVEAEVFLGVEPGTEPVGDVPDDLSELLRPTTIVAAGHTITIPDLPPAAWFDEPVDVPAYGALTVTDEGRLYGYLAPAGVAHIGQAARTEVPRGNVDYSRYLGGETIVAGGGRVVTGAVTMDCGHASTAHNDPMRALAHYDNTCSVVAAVRVGENANGVWVAGALYPWVDAQQVQKMLACRLSGDWRAHRERPGWREFCAALLVPVPGFPMGRRAASVRMEEGQLVAAAVPLRLSGRGDDSAGAQVRLIAQAIGRAPEQRIAAARAAVHGR